MEIERAVLDELRPAFDEEYLRQLAEAALPDPDTFDYRGEIKNIEAKTERRKAEKVRLARKLAEDEGGLDFLRDAVAEIDSEIDELQQEKSELELKMQLQSDRSTRQDQIEYTAIQMASKLDNLDDESTQDWST